MSKQIPDAEFIGGGANAAEYWGARAEKAERRIAELEGALRGIAEGWCDLVDYDDDPTCLDRERKGDPPLNGRCVVCRARAVLWAEWTEHRTPEANPDEEPDGRNTRFGV